ncbi:uncharacterized protein LOC126374177 [Pectinophora gossypiella]|uniref:uncharacterized protein LOC126374177 n=1 Tax=Pectinophora gossypiella TaxID=13191 RepID=UPI00214E3F13|nr:uncharacterized protein LOC126374177 [Pectinophora gossypiella]
MIRPVVFLMFVLAVALCKPLNNETENSERSVADSSSVTGHSLWKRFINPALSFGGITDGGISKMRTKRSVEDCEKLQLCKLHARSRHNFIAAFELYFVNKENARLWDHHAHSIADCEQRFSCYDR